MAIRCLSDARAELGESPVWAETEGCVYWVDIQGRRLHRTGAAGAGRAWDMPSRPGMVALRARGGLVVALEDGLHAFDPETAVLELLVAIEPDHPENRANDGKCDGQGRLFVGTMHGTDAANPSGSLYRIDGDLSVSQVRGGLRVPNGLAWSPDGGTMYHTDTRSGVVLAFDYDADSGAISGQRDFFRFDRAVTGGVDGAAMAADGTYWAAMYGGGRLIGVGPAGDVLAEIALPVSQPTMPAFGGAGLDMLYVTSARQRLDDTALARQPGAGALLSLPAPDGVTGHPVHPFAG